MFLPPSKCFLVLLPLLAAQAQNLTYTTPQVFPYAEISGSPIQTSNNPITAVAGDFNGDGIKDFVLLAQLAGTSSLQFFAGSVAGQFVGANQFVCSQNDICYKIAAGDLDGDGDLDLAVSTSAGIQIYINDGSGRFSAVNFYATPSTVLDLAAVDLDGDGALDLVYSRKTASSSTVSSTLINGALGVMRQIGPGSFGSEVILPTSSTFLSKLVAVDITNDGKPDLVVIDDATASISALQNNSTPGNFSFVRSTLNIGTLRAGAIAVGDFNRDGKPDIAAAVYDSAAPSSSLYGDQLLLLQGNGDGTFSMVSGSMGLNPAPTNALRVADVNGDQNPDLVVVSNNYLSVFFGNGVFSSSTPPFTPANGYYYSPNGNMAGIDIADFNFDGMPDLVVPDGGIDGVGVAAVQVFFNSTPTFSATPSVVDVYSAAGTNPAGITFTVSTASTVPGTYSIYSSQPVYVAPSLSSNGLPGTSIFTANFNTASLPPGNYQFPITLASATYFQRQVLIKLHVRAPAGTLRVASNNATGAGTSPVLIRTGDFNKDGKLDYAALSSAAGQISIFLGAGGGTFNAASGSPLAVPPGSVDFAVGDLDGDGKLDLAIVAPTAVQIYRGDGTGVFTSSRSKPMSIPAGIVIADFDGDGINDLAITLAASGGNPASLAIVRGLGRGFFNQVASLGVGLSPGRIGVGDFNGDGRPDLAVVNNGSNNVTVLLNSNGVGFLPGTSYAVGNSPSDIAVGDLNGDGKLDFAVSNNLGQSITLLQGNGAGTFANVPPINLGYPPLSVAIGDVDGDGRRDLLITRSGAFTVYLGTPTAFSFGSNVVFNVPGTQYARVEDINSDFADDVVIGQSSTLTTSAFVGDRAPTTTSISSQLTSPQPVGTSISLSAGVVSFNSFVPVTGTTTFFDGATNLGNATQQAPIYSFTAATPPIGAHTYSAAFAGNARLAPSISSPFNMVIGSTTQTVTITGVPSYLAINSSFTVTASASSNLPVTISTSPNSVCTISGSTITGITPGTCTVTASQAGGSGYSPASTSQSFSVINPVQTLTLQGVPSFLLVGQTAKVTATSSSGLTVTITTNVSGICTISGSTVTAVGIGTCILTASQAGGSGYNPASISQSFSTVATSLTVSGSPPRGVTGQPYSASFIASGGSGKYSFSVASLPDGLNLGSNGQLSGIPALAGDFPIIVTATDLQYGTTGNLLATLSIAGIVTPATLTNGVIGRSYAVNLQAVGFSGTPTWTAQTTPPGLTLSPAGFLTGIPTQPGKFSFSVSATAGVTVSRIFTMTVLDVPKLLGTPPNGKVGIAYAFAFQVTGGVAPYSVSLAPGTFVPTGLTLGRDGSISGMPTVVGTSSFTVIVADSLGTSSSTPSSITIDPLGAAITLSLGSFSFKAPADGTVPPQQSFTITSSIGNPVNFALDISPGSLARQEEERTAAAPAGLFVVTGATVTPATLTLSIDPLLYATLPPGTYTATLIITPRLAGATPTSCALSVTVAAAPPKLLVAPTFLHFDATANLPGIQSGSITVSNSGGGTLTFAASTTASFITFVTAGGSATLGNPAIINFNVDSRGLASGQYLGSVVVTSSTGSFEVPVVLLVTAANSAMLLGQTGIRFLANDNSSGAPPQVVSVLNVGSPGASFVYSVNIVSGSEWLRVSASSSPVTPSSPGAITLTPIPETPRSSNPRYAIIRVDAPNTQNAPSSISVVLDPAQPTAIPQPSPSGIFFIGATRSGSGVQSVRVDTNTSTAVRFQTSITGGSWLTATPSDGTTSATKPATISVAFDAKNLTPGIYVGGVNIGIGTTVRVVNVTLIVTTQVPSASSSMSAARDANCAPSKLALVSTGLPGNFSVPAAWPASLVIRMADDCGTLVSNGKVVVSFSNGDPPVTLLSDRISGTYSGTWNVGTVSPSMTVTATGTASGLPASTTTLVGGIIGNPTPPPAISPNGIVHNSDPRLGGALAPGNVVAVFGTGLASQTASPGVVPLPTSFNGTQVIVGGIEAPLYFLSPGQLNVQIPYELAPFSRYQVVAIVNNAVSSPQAIDLVGQVPGITAFSDGRLIAQHADYSLVSASSPAKPGEILVMYLAGMGFTNIPVRSGALSPATTVSVPAAVTVDGIDAEVFYAGLTPGGIGLYQINFRVPANVKPGNLKVQVTQGTATSNAAILPVIP